MEDKPEFKVKLGDIAQLQFIPDDGRDRLNAKVIGHAPNKSLILSAPMSAGGKISILRENQRFVVRMLQGNKVFGFESEVLKYYTLPYPHVHLAQPKDVECIVVRGARRINLGNLVISVQSEQLKAPAAATVINISATGALLHCKQIFGKLDDKISFSVEFNISGIQKYLRIHAIIRNFSTPEDHQDEDDGHYRYGLQFLDMDDDQRLIVTAYVHEQVVKQLED